MKPHAFKAIEVYCLQFFISENLRDLQRSIVEFSIFQYLVTTF